MKRSSKLLAILLTACLIFGALAVSVLALSTNLIVDKSGVINVGNHTFEGYVDGSTYFNGGNGTVKPSGGSVWTNATYGAETDVIIKTETVNGVSNKYMSITPVSGVTSMSGSESSACVTYLASKTIISSTIDRDFIITEFDIRATRYVTKDASGKYHLYDSLDEITDPTELASAKLSYPEGMYFYIPVTGKNSSGNSTGGIQRYFSIVSKNNEWYLTTNNSSSVGQNYNVSEACKLPGGINEWNHITFIQRFTGSTSGNADRIELYAYINGQYAGKASSTGYNAAITSSISYSLRMHLLKSTCLISEPSYAFDMDNFSSNLYEASYTPDVDSSFLEIFEGTFDSSRNLVEFGDLVYNYDYVSPHGTSYGVKWVDTEGKVLFGDRVPVGSIPTVDGAILDLGSYGGALGDYKNIDAWEWNVSADPSVFTPVSALTGDMIGTLKARSDDMTLTIRPAISEVVYKDEGGSVIKTEKYFAGNTVSGIQLESNGWYSVRYNSLTNLTEGAEDDSLTVKGGVTNVFECDTDSADFVAAIDGVKVNMSLLTNYYMNIYVPSEAPAGITPIGYFADEDLTFKYEKSVMDVVIGDTSYTAHSFSIRNSDIDLASPRYFAFDVVIGEKTYRLAYEISVDLIGYVEGVLNIYSCQSNEASLAVGLLNYANEAYLLAGGDKHVKAEEILSAHSSCGCAVEYDVVNDYKGNVMGLLDYVTAAAYDVTSQQPSLVIYVKADKASEISSVSVSYNGIDGIAGASLKKLSATKLNGVDVVPYSLIGISAADVKEIMNISIIGNNGASLASGSYGLSNYVFNNDVAVAEALYKFSIAAANYKKGNGSAGDSPEAPAVMGGISVSKTNGLRPSLTLNPGEEVTYKITVTNNADEAFYVPVVDKLPANTTFVSGDLILDGFDLYTELLLASGETRTISYTVKIDSNKKLINGGYLATTTCTAGGNEASSTGNYIGLTFNSYDERYMAKGIEAISYSENVDAMSIVKMMYTVAFSKSATLSNTPAEILSFIFENSATESGAYYRSLVVPTLYSGANVRVGLRGESASLYEADLIAGDLLFIKNSGASSVYIYNGAKLVSVTNGYESCNTASVIELANSADNYAVIRPSLNITSRVPMTSDPMENKDLTVYQEALLDTAEAYIQRGYRLQYDDGNLGTSSEYRWQIGLYQPEDYTSQKWGYINCAGFTYDIYRMALGYDLGGLYTTNNLMDHFTYGGKENDMYPFYYEWNAEASSNAAMRESVQARFLDTLEVGDLVVVTRGTEIGGYGHVMLYVGDGMLVHSSGSTRSGDNEYYEATIRYMNVVSYLFDPTASNYLFTETTGEKTVYQTCIVRPLANISGEIPENTLNRMENLDDIFAEKLSTHPEGKTVNKGAEITYTFKIKNVGASAKTLEVCDVVPENSILVRADGAAIDKDKLSWSVTVAPGETVSVSYTVSADGEYGEYIENGSATVGGVAHGCPRVYIEKTLTEDEQNAILEAIEYYKKNNTEGLTNIALVNAIYTYAGLDAPFVDESGNDVSISTVRDSLMKNVTVSGSTLWQTNTSSEYYEMLAPTLYGGARYYTKNNYNSTNKTSTDRSRLPREQALCIGDIVIARFSDSKGAASYAFYMYAGGEHLIKLTSATLDADTSYPIYHRLQRLLSVGNYYVILRPSMGE